MLRISSILNTGLAKRALSGPTWTQSSAPFIVASLPAFICSLANANIIMPLICGVTAYQLFLKTQQTDPIFFQMTKTRARLAVTYPLCLFITIWGIALAMLGHKQMMNGIVGPFCIMLLIACAPAYRWKPSRTERRVPLWISFSIAGLIAVTAAFASVL
jgi:hypothetical protein